MHCLLDTTILVRWANRRDPLRPLALTALRRLKQQGRALFVTPQNMIEPWNVLTRPVSVGGLGLSPAQAALIVRRIRRLFSWLPDTPAVFDEWLRLVETVGVSGRQVHDARLVAVMRAHGITHILTFNDADFRRYETLPPALGNSIVVVNPQDV